MKCLLLPLVFLALAGCSGFSSNERLPFEWIQLGNTMVFDFHPVGDTLTGPGGIVYGYTRGALVITIEEGVGDAVVLRAAFPLWSNDGGINSRVVPRQGLDALAVERTEGGLQTAVYGTCATIPLPGLPLTRFLRVPAVPEIGDRYPQYRCGDSIETTIQVEQVQYEIEVPAGTFSSFILVERRNGAREYWSEREGLLRIELLEEDESLLGYYELASRTFSN